MFGAVGFAVYCHYFGLFVSDFITFNTSVIGDPYEWNRFFISFSFVEFILKMSFVLFFILFILHKESLRITFFECTSLIINCIDCKKAVTSTVLIGHLFDFLYVLLLFLFWNIAMPTSSSAVIVLEAFTYTFWGSI